MCGIVAINIEDISSDQIEKEANFKDGELID